MNRRVLIVDDDVLMVTSLTEVLELHGWSVMGAYRGLEAIEAVKELDFDVVVMDVGMPGMDGVTALQGILEARPGQPVILMTGYSQTDVRDIFRERDGSSELWVERVITKPFPPDELVQLLEESISSDRK